MRRLLLPLAAVAGGLAGRAEAQASEAACVAGLDTTNYNGATIDTVVGITDQAACCDACSKNLKCQRWVLDTAGAKCDLLPSGSMRMIGAFGFVSGTVAPSYGGGGAGGWGKTFLIALIVVSSVYLVGGATYRYKAGSRGVDMIPQNRFWAALPGLVFDGVQYTRGLTGSEGGATPVAADGAQTTGLSDEVPDYGAADDGESSSSSKRGKKGKREKQSPADSDRSRSSKGSRGSRSSKGSKGGKAKEKKARKKSRPRNDLDEPDEEAAGLLEDGGGEEFDTRQLTEHLDDADGGVHSSQAKVKVFSLRE